MELAIETGGISLFTHDSTVKLAELLLLPSLLPGGLLNHRQKGFSYVQLIEVLLMCVILFNYHILTLSQWTLK